MKNIYILTLLASLLVLAACTDLVGDKRNLHPFYIISALLPSGGTVNADNPIFVGKTVSANGGNVLDMVEPNANVVLQDLTAGTSINLTYVGFELFGFYVDTNSEMPIVPLHTYKITAVIGADSLTAQTTVPAATEFILDAQAYSDSAATAPGVNHRHYDTDYPLVLEADTQRIRIYAEFFCLIDDYMQAEYVVDMFGDHPSDEDEYMDPVDMYPRRIKYWNEYTTDANNQIKERGYQSAFMFYGPYQLKIYTIDENYYHYLYETEGYTKGGVEGGWGYFGSYQGITKYTVVE